MKVVILAGGKGTRLSEETADKPKPMVDIGGRPILWHIMKIYAAHGFKEFVILLGYRGYFIKEYFANYFLHQSDVTFDLENNSMEVHANASEPWKVTLLNTGIDTMTGGRLKRAQTFLEGEPFMLTYGDGVSDINIHELVEFHRSHESLMTVTTVQPQGRFGQVTIDDDARILNFFEKPRGDGGWINGGFFVCDPGVFDYIDNDATVLEQEPLKRLAADGQLRAYKHFGYWRAMDTLRDKNHLDEVYRRGAAQWKMWQV